MERSQSCSSFLVKTNNKSNNNNNISNEINKNKSLSSSAHNLRKAIELRQTQLQQLKHLHQLQQQKLQLQQQQQQLQKLQQQEEQTQELFKCGSNENTNELNQIPSLFQISSRQKPKKQLKRQKTTTEYIDDDMAYAADHEEDDEDEAMHTIEDEDVFNKTILESTTVESAQQPLYVMPINLNTNLPTSPAVNNVNCRTNYTLSPSSSFSSSKDSSSPIIKLQHQRRLRYETSSFDSTTGCSMTMSPTTHRRHHFAQLKRDNSIHSDSSRYSSVDSLLESRKPDPEAILINLGFGPVGSEDILSRIPKRFLKPSQVRGIDTDAFVRRLQLADTLADHSVLGYRGLTGNPDIPPSTIVAKIMHRFEVNERKKSMGSIEHTIQ